MRQDVGEAAVTSEK